MYPGLYEVHTTPGADRTARGEEWLQTNTLDGTKDIEAFIKPDEPSYFQEFGPGGYHVAVGFANPKIINDRKADVCAVHRGLHRHHQRRGDQCAHEPYPGSARVQQRQLRPRTASPSAT